MGKGRRIQIGKRVKSDHLETALRKRRGGKEQRSKGVGIGIKLFILIFWNCCGMFKKNVIRNWKVRRAK
jgi:hypothetical protein